MIYALDSNTVTFLLKKDKQVETNFIRVVDDGNQYIVPPMVYYEVRRWLLLKNAPVKLSLFDNILCRFTNEITIGKFCWDKAIEIYVDLAQKGQLIPDGDILIAAYCLLNDYTLVTDDTDHFERIDGLSLVNWKE